MASSKKRNKAAKRDREAKHGKPKVHPDGDRRRRGGTRIEDAIARKRAMQTFPGEILPDEPGR